MYVKTEYRRRGVATALLARMHEEGRETGATATVLLASHNGSKLYEAIGYQTLGLMATFTPRKSDSTRT